MGKCKNFNSDSTFESSVKEDFARVVSYDSDGVEFVTYEKVDYSKIVERNGVCVNWSLTSLLKAGINPDFGIRTGLNTRLAGVAVVQQLAAEVDGVFNESNKDE